MDGINLVIASGKGGTGKTMVATSLAASLALNHKIQFLDCDVEAPNAHLFLNPEIEQEQPAVLLVPEIDAVQCTLCEKCVKGCAYHALARLSNQILLFPQLCHGCGSCALICPEKAIAEKPREVGRLTQGETKHGIHYLMGELTVSEPMPTPIIHQLKTLKDNTMEITILDAPPGASCAVVETLHDADFVILVTEPTPFGLHDLRQMLGILDHINLPGGVIINRADIGTEDVSQFIQSTRYPILMEIPFQKRIAAGLARGKLLVEICPFYQMQFIEIYQRILFLLGKKAGAA